VIYRLLADVVMIVHFLFIALVAGGSVLAWRWPQLVVAHVPAVVWAAAIVSVGFTCPLTVLEKELRLRAGGSPYDGGFIDHYLDGAVYPGRFIGLTRLAVAMMIIVGYAGLLLRHRRTPSPDLGGLRSGSGP
jgi:hypothetical protein